MVCGNRQLQIQNMLEKKFIIGLLISQQKHMLILLMGPYIGYHGKIMRLIWSSKEW